MPCVQDFRSNAPRQRVPSRALVQPRDIGAARTELVVTKGPGAGPVRAVRPRSWKTHQKRPRRCLLGSEEGSDGQDLMAPSGWQPQPPRGDSKAAFPTRCRRGLFARGETRYPAPRLGELSGDAGPTLCGQGWRWRPPLARCRGAGQLRPAAGGCPTVTSASPTLPLGAAAHTPPPRASAGEPSCFRGTLPVLRAHRVAFPSASERWHCPGWSNVPKIPHLNWGGSRAAPPPQSASLGCFLPNSTPDLWLPTNKSPRQHRSMCQCVVYLYGGSLNPGPVCSAPRIPVDLGGKRPVSACAERAPCCSVPWKKRGRGDCCQRRSREGSDLAGAGNRNESACYLLALPSSAGRPAPLF
ncbi:uncharacterized protein LOC129206704 [Grus americana]|uniref:uncharacterized protein LOC129206704 n=1 Tax=Grus americana TaxID=9117 RepID=UPI002407B696|nr:uncharacterized protein LOC129206704 [Grus americana]